MFLSTRKSVRSFTSRFLSFRTPDLDWVRTRQAFLGPHYFSKGLIKKNLQKFDEFTTTKITLIISFFFLFLFSPYSFFLPSSLLSLFPFLILHLSSSLSLRFLILPVLKIEITPVSGLVKTWKIVVKFYLILGFISVFRSIPFTTMSYTETT